MPAPLAPTTPASPPPARTAALVSVGGSTEPVLLSLRTLRTDVVWYFCSPQSRVLAEDLHRQLEWRPLPDFIEVERFEELGPCYAALRDALPRLLHSWRLGREHVTVDYTGGTKTMSAALVLAAVEHLHQFCYVGGTGRDKAGLGTVASGTEVLRLQPNPWRELGVREADRIGLLWQSGSWDEAAAALDALVALHPRPERCGVLAGIARATAARHRFDFKSAADTFARAASKVKQVFESDGATEPVAYVESARKLCEACREKSGTVSEPEVLLRELIDNSLRTASLGRYDDAAARLYRAIEMQAQLWLAAATDGAFHNGRLRSGQSLPDKLVGCPVCAPSADGRVDLAMEELFRALAWLGHPQAKVVIEEIDTSPAKSRWRHATARRNTSILAHGVLPVGPEGFADLRSIATGLVGLAVTHEANPIPPFQPSWLR
jgi:CRISPR-associated protein (TIGR02710 family)